MPNLKPSTILKRARKLIEKGWCRGRPYLTRGGRTHYCSIGALREEGSVAGDYACSYLKQGMGCQSITSWNDGQSSKRPVLAAFDRAIAFAEKEGK